MFNVKNLSMHKLQMHAGAISKLLYGFVYKALGLSPRTDAQTIQ